MSKTSQPLTKYGSKQRILEQSKQQKLAKARELVSSGEFYQAIQMYHKVLFLSQKAEYMIELAEIYQNELMDVSSAILFYRRALHLKPKSYLTVKERLKQLLKIKGLQLLQLGACKNILQGSYLQEEKDSDYQLMEQFRRVYPNFHQRLLSTYIRPASDVLPLATMIKFLPDSPIKDSLQGCLAYLQTNNRQFAMEEIENCLQKEQKNVNLIVLKALLSWCMLEKQIGYRLFWDGYKIDKQHPKIALFLKLIIPKVQELYKEAKYDLIEGNLQKCKLKVERGLQMHPYHNDLLALKAFLHRSKSEYKQALDCLQIASTNLQSEQKSIQLKGQISLTYNQMAIYLYKQHKYDQAIDLFTQGLKYKPTDYGLLTNRGDCHRAVNNFVKALEDYLLAYELEKKSPQLNFRISSIYSIRGVSLFNSKNYQLALKQFDYTLRYTPKNEQFLLSKAKCLIQLNRKQETIQLLIYTLQLYPTFNQVKAMLLQLKDPEEKRGPNNRKIIQLTKEKS